MSYPPYPPLRACPMFICCIHTVVRVTVHLLRLVNAPAIEAAEIVEKLGTRDEKLGARDAKLGLALTSLRKLIRVRV